jgi:hypothetical protein
MAALNIVIDARFGLTADLSPVVVKNFNRPEADVRPWETISVIPEPAPLYQGHPVAPLLWSQSSVALTLDGSSFSGDRPAPADLDINADVFWLPYANSWDSTNGIWAPWVSVPIQFSWEQPTVIAQPVFSEISYRLGREIIVTPQVTFSPTTWLRSNFYDGAYQALTFTMSFVVLLRSATTGPYAIMDWGSAGGGPVPDTRPYLTAGERINYRWGGAIGVVDPIQPLPALRPAFITLVVSPPSVTCYVSTGPRHTFSTTQAAADGVGLSGTPLQFYLANSGADSSLANGSFSMLAASLWGRPLDLSEITALNSKYASVWGASNDWS